MRKDPTEFRERFLRWKKGELVYENGLALPAYEDGKDANNVPSYIPSIDDREQPGYRKYLWELSKARRNAFLKEYGDAAPIKNYYEDFLSNSGGTFNYRRWYNLASPAERKYGLEKGLAHWRDADGKTSLHPSFSIESPYSGYKNPYNPKGITGGKWIDDDHYEFSDSQINNDWPINKTLDEFDWSRKEEGSNTYGYYKGGVMLHEPTIIGKMPKYKDGLTPHKKSEVNTNLATYNPEEDLYTGRYTLPEVTVTGDKSKRVYHSHAPRTSGISKNQYKLLTGDLLGAMTTGMNVLSPSLWWGAIRDSEGLLEGFNRLMRGNSGFTSEVYAQNNPLTSAALNLVGDALALRTIGQTTKIPNAINQYNKNVAKLKRIGLSKPYDYFDETINQISRKKAFETVIPDKNERLQFKMLYNRYAHPLDKMPSEAELREITGVSNADDLNRMFSLFRNNPEYLDYLRTRYQKYPGIQINPYDQKILDDYFKIQGTSIRGVHAESMDDAIKYLTETNPKRNMPGGDRLGTKGGLYVSNSPTVADTFKNSQGSLMNGYVGTLYKDLEIPHTLTPEEQLMVYRNKIYPTANSNPLSGTIYEIPAKEDAIKNGAIAYEADYVGRANKGLPGYERAYLPGKEIERPVNLQNVLVFEKAADKKGRWMQGQSAGDNDGLFFSRQLNRTTDFIKLARPFLKGKAYNHIKESQARYELQRFFDILRSNNSALRYEFYDNHHKLKNKALKEAAIALTAGPGFAGTTLLFLNNSERNRFYESPEYAVYEKKIRSLGDFQDKDALIKAANKLYVQQKKKFHARINEERFKK